MTGLTALVLGLGSAGCEEDTTYGKITEEQTAGDISVQPVGEISVQPPTLEPVVGPYTIRDDIINRIPDEVRYPPIRGVFNDCPDDDEWSYGVMHEITSLEGFYDTIRCEDSLVAFLTDADPEYLLQKTVLINLARWYDNETKGFLRVASVEMDTLPALFGSEGIETIPTYKYFSENYERADLTLVGETSQEDLASNAELLLNGWEVRISHPESYGDLLTEIENAGDTAVLVDLNAEWCYPCQLLNPFMEDISIMYSDQVYDEDKLKVISFNVDLYTPIWGEWGVAGIPHLTFFYQGERHSEFDISGFRDDFNYYETRINNALDSFYGEGWNW